MKYYEKKFRRNHSEAGEIMEQKKWNRNDRRPPLRRAQEPSEAAENMLEGRNSVK